MSGGFVFPNPANPGGQPNLADILNSKKAKAGKTGGFGKGGIFGGIAAHPTGVGLLDIGTPKQQAGSLAEAIERQAAAQQAQAAMKGLGGGATDPFTALQQQLFGAANNINVAPTPIEQLRQMAQQQVSAQYDPQMQALSRDMTAHMKRGAQSEQKARDMYGALAKDYLSQLPDITAQYQAQDQATNQRYDQAQQQMSDEYQKNADQQNAVLKQLGIQAAAPQADQQAADDQAYFQNQSNADQQSALDALTQQQMAQQDYTRNLGSNAKFAGENTAQDINSQVRDYVDNANSQLSSLAGQKGAAVAALLAQLQQQDAQRVQTQSQTQFDNMMKLYNFQLAAEKASNSSQGGAGGFGAGQGLSGLTSGLPGAQNYLASVYPQQPILASHLMEQLNNVLSDPNVTNGKYVMTPASGNPGEPGYQAAKYSNVGQQYMEDLLRHQFEKQGGRYNTGDINATMAALEAYLGKLR